MAGHYLPLADNPGVAPEPDQTCSPQSDQRTLQNRIGFALHSRTCPSPRQRVEGWGKSDCSLTTLTPILFRKRERGKLLNFRFRAGIQQLFQRCVRIGLRNGFLHSLR